ncbi:hypothetical protein INT46_003779 [Mucor plumbeus]|uniref:Uncharacterized protein n=1 Tax=Mucor plumbeus TaxID=97098 RepID=A0A8H7QG04_9FUNG|nr:hypothetical protein INT46_003779 [Mucor plumbeus]
MSNINNNSNSSIISTLNELRTEVFGMRTQLSEQKTQIETLLKHQLLPTNSSEANAYKYLPLNGYLDVNVRSRMLSNPDRLGCRNIPSIPKLLKDSIAFNNNSISYGKRNFPAINVRLNALIQEMHLRKYGDNAVELDQASIDQAKVPLQKLAADVCQLIRGNSSTELLRWSQLSSGDQLFYSLVFEDIAAAHIDLGNVYQCHDRWGANGFLGLAFKAAKQKHDRIERKNRNETNTNATSGRDDATDDNRSISSSESNRFEDDDEPISESSSEDGSLSNQDEEVLSCSRSRSPARFPARRQTRSRRCR